MAEEEPTPEDQYAVARQLQSSGDPRRALPEWSKLKKLVNDDPQHPMYVEAIRQKAVCHRLIGETGIAQTLFEQALNLARDGEHHDKEVSILRDWSALWLEQHYYQHALDKLREAIILFSRYRLDIAQLRITHAYMGRVYGHSRSPMMQRKGRELLRRSNRTLQKRPDFKDQYLDNRIWMLEPPTIWRFVHAPRTIGVAVRQRRWRRLVEIAALLIGGMSLRRQVR